MSHFLRRCRCRRAALLLTAVAVPAIVPAQDQAVARTTTKTTFAAAADFSYTTFSGDTDPWRVTTVSLARRSAGGSLIARVNHARRFGTDGAQVELDAYPRVSDNVYLYLNAGYSGATIFPEWRVGGEAFTSLPGAWEASLGFRQLHFGGTPVTLFTGAVGRYIGNYWLSLRPYVRSKDGGLSASAGLTARRYFEDGDHWVGVAASYGNSPTDRVTPDAVGRTDALAMSLNGSTGLTTRLLTTWSLGYDAEELTPGNTRTRVTLTAGLKLTF